MSKEWRLCVRSTVAHKYTANYLPDVDVEVIDSAVTGYVVIINSETTTFNTKQQ